MATTPIEQDGPTVCRAVVTLQNAHGLHARPAHLFVQTANSFAASLTVGRVNGGDQVDGKSIMGMMMLAAEQGTALEMVTDGPDALELLRALLDLVEAGFGEG